MLHLCGDDPHGHETIAAAIAQRAGYRSYVLRIEDTPAAGEEMDRFVQLWTRDALLTPALLVLQWADDAPTPAARRLAEHLPGPLIVASRDPLWLHRAFTQIEADKAGPAGQKQMWRAALGAEAATMPAVVDDLAQQFRFSGETIASIAASSPLANGAPSAAETSRLWNACRRVSRPRLSSLAERIVPCATWDDLVLPEMQKRMLRDFGDQSRHRMRVYEEWGFAAKGRRGLGLSALFCGTSGSGKTMAAEVIASELDIDLYKIDLSSVVSKYIGETEKNLDRIFNAAENANAILFFDEADALFGKRSEVKDSHDRYANIEVSYLLQRMESFQGISVLTTNKKSAVDQGFQRRLRLIVDFPFPDVAQREAIWARVFPAQTPTRDLQLGRLAALNVAGGNIRNIAVNAAFLAASSDRAVSMSDVLQAARLESVKTERPISEREIRGWAS